MHERIQAALATMWRRHNVCHMLETTQYYLFDVYSTYLNGYLVKLTREISIRYVPSIVTQCHHLLHICSDFVPILFQIRRNTDSLLEISFARFLPDACAAKSRKLLQSMEKLLLISGYSFTRTLPKVWRTCSKPFYHKIIE